VARDLDAHRKEIQMLLEQEIISAYYYQGGQLQVALRKDKMLTEAERILNDNDTYQRILKSENLNTKED
jgi:carboxyl-terminal processing protease